MHNHLQTNIQLSAQNRVIDTSNTQQSLDSKTPLVTKAEVVLDNTNQVIVNPQDFTKQWIAKQWYQQCSQQAYASFYLAIGTSVATVFLSIAIGVSVSTGNISQGVAETVLGICSGAASVRLFKIYENENTRLNEVAKTLLESEKSK